MINKIVNSIINTIATNSSLIFAAWAGWLISTLTLQDFSQVLPNAVQIAASIHFNIFLITVIPIFSSFVFNIFWDSKKANTPDYYVAGGVVAFIVLLSALLYITPTLPLEFNREVITTIFTTNWEIDLWYVVLTSALFIVVYFSRIFYQIHKADRMIQYLEKINTEK